MIIYLDYSFKQKNVKGVQAVICLVDITVGNWARIKVVVQQKIIYVRRKKHRECVFFFVNNQRFTFINDFFISEFIFNFW